MSDQTKIEWADATWNPITGCTPISIGCCNCYAERMVRRFPKVYPNGFDVTIHIDRFDQPRRWRKPRRIFVCSMGDLFHDDVPAGDIGRVFDVMRECSQHTFMVLTKRPVRMNAFTSYWPGNLWAGVTVETEAHLWRFDCLSRTGYPLRFVSCEPLLGPIPQIFPRHGGRQGPDWVIVGCESGPKRRPMVVEWARGIQRQCAEAHVPFFLKQMAVDDQVVKMPELDGRICDERPSR